ncbi:hypothetical protein RHSIM_Rhsim02G0051400 [Rhododendron simsii]|uniref:Alpha-1,3/1,6-mannosyltransferase ALG2 n=1 Tax=Rhododendron simsii TaxID=118357 RepID=A0A834LV53_RHOSS|nr:hypothetical protein RHSIM_Rhsim02G0051400 [Rhododendron simsii]
MLIQNKSGELCHLKELPHGHLKELPHGPTSHNKSQGENAGWHCYQSNTKLDGIRCDCCKETLALAEFDSLIVEAKSNNHLRIHISSPASSLFQCLVDSWSKHDGSECTRAHPVEVDGGDPNDDADKKEIQMMIHATNSVGVFYAVAILGLFICRQSTANNPELPGGRLKKYVRNVLDHVKETDREISFRLACIKIFKCKGSLSANAIIILSFALQKFPSGDFLQVLWHAYKPVIACNSGGPVETIKNGVMGFLCDPSPQEFSSAMEKFIRDPQMAERMGFEAQQHVVESFSTKVFGQRLNQILLDIAREKED